MGFDTLLYTDHCWTSPTLPTELTEPHWYALYTRSRHEKRVAEQCERRSIETFLPLYESVRHWKDRRVRLDLPLFAGYVFVRTPLKERLKVLEIPSVVRFIGFNGLPTALPDSEIEALRIILLARLRAEPYPFLSVGQRVRIVHGSLEGITGILVRKKGTLRVVLSVNSIMRSAAVEVDATEVERL